ncbi:uncharacterized protein BYT42DRAFT_289715 [Radiomyces spectabilis]|uniref:uncharacterized protein n=1 Tax=Radiomyces spectabilis TaxID=64574 RepID=UPI00221E6342|nr:uncharacterized protein BYT42DRAFT_289715 [Radiomyces spectabilis]KAI8381037.1 hypothetical protein BYT42DRAFT_289715 [Radiomyces spectabilis]
MPSLQVYASKVTQFSRNENGKQLAALFSLTDQQGSSMYDHNMTIAQLEGQLGKKLAQPWNEIAVKHLKAFILQSEGRYGEAFEAQKDLVQVFQRAMISWDRWCLPILYVINSDLRMLATQADHMEVAAEGQRKKLEDAANVISKSFTYCITDRGVLATSKKYGTYRVIGMLFRIYFKLKQPNLCKNILRALSAADMPSIEDFPKSDRVTFRYYVGRFFFLEEDYLRAEQELSLAFKECSRHQQKNKELILLLLLPIRMMRGVLPNDRLLRLYPRTRELYGNIAAAIRTGNVGQFDAALAKAELQLIQNGTYFAVEKAQIMAMRRLFHRVFLLLGKNTRIPIGTFKAALEYTGQHMEVEETEWMLAVMITRGYMKGYLSHEKLYLVLSNKDAFPAITTL